MISPSDDELTDEKVQQALQDTTQAEANAKIRAVKLFIYSKFWAQKS